MNNSPNPSKIINPTQKVVWKVVAKNTSSIPYNTNVRVTLNWSSPIIYGRVSTETDIIPGNAFGDGSANGTILNKTTGVWLVGPLGVGQERTLYIETSFAPLTNLDTVLPLVLTKSLTLDSSVESNTINNVDTDVLFKGLNVPASEADCSQVRYGPAGPPGPIGADGLSAYQLAVIGGFVGSIDEWLLSLVGPSGQNGQGVPIGGTEGQFLEKVNGTNFNTTWKSHASRPWVKLGDTNANSGTIVNVNDNIFHNGFVAIGVTSNLETQNNDTAVIKAANEKIGLRLKTDELSSGFKPIVFDYSNINNVGFPNFDFRANRFDGINGIDPKPNLVTRFGYNAGSGAPPSGQIKLETAFEYYYNLQNANPLVAPDIVAEWHVEFTPLESSGRPIQRWISWFGRHNGTKTDCTITSDTFNIFGSDNRQILKIEDDGLLPTAFRFVRGGKILSNVGDVEFENAIKISGAGNIYNSNGGDLNFGTSTNKNFSNFYGLTAANGVIQRLKNDNLTSGFDFRINSVPSFTLTQPSTGNDILTIFGGAPNFSMVVRASGNIGFGGLYSPVHPIQHNNGAHLTAAGAWTNASDKAYKKNVKITSYGLKDVLKLKPVEYIHRSSGLKQIGLIAQDVEKIMPEFVSGDEGSKGVNYSQMVSVLIMAIKQQQEIIENLK